MAASPFGCGQMNEVATMGTEQVARVTRYYRQRTLKLLWGRAAGRCAVPECRVELFAKATDHDPIVVIGDIAHIEAASDRGPRANLRKSRRLRDEYENLILLCRNCHAKLDGQKHTNSVEAIRQLRQEHEAWVRANLPERGKSRTGWTTIFLEGTHPIDKENALTALSPDYSASHCSINAAPSVQGGWDSVHHLLEKQVSRLFHGRDDFDCRFAVFPLAPVSSCITLGYLLTSRPHVRLFQHHRDEHAWRWRAKMATAERPFMAGLPRSPVRGAGDLAICFNLSATILEYHLDDLGRRFMGRVDLRVRRPGIGWLRDEHQLSDFASVCREVFEGCTSLFPRAKAWHLFCAVPAPAVVVLGQQLNPTMTPPVQLYEFDRRTQPSYQPSLTLGGAAGGQ